MPDFKEVLKNKLLQDLEILKTPGGYLNAGYPNYYMLFGRDALISAWQMLEINPEIAKSSLKILAKYQGKTVHKKAEEEPGKILHEYPFELDQQATLSDWDFPYFGTVDATPLFVIVADKYFQKTGDKSFLLQIWKNIVLATNWMSTYGDVDQDYFVEYERKIPKGLFHQAWRDSYENHLKISSPVAIVEVQGYVYAAYLAAARMAKVLGQEVNPEWQERATELKERFHQSFWWEEEQYYALALDGNKKQRRSVSSNPGHLLFTGILPAQILPQIVKRLFQPDLFTPYGIQTVSKHDPDFDSKSYHLGSVWPHDNWIIYYGLKQLGFLREADQIKQALLLVHQELGRIPELFGVENDQIIPLSIGARQHGVAGNVIHANSIQAWAICGLLEMIWED